jgi:hypothetical protein
MPNEQDKIMIYECSCRYVVVVHEKHLIGREGWVHACPNIVQRDGEQVRCGEKISYLKLLRVIKLTKEYRFGEEKIEKMLELGDVLK